MPRTISPQEADQMCRSGHAVFIDIRETDEFIHMRIPGARLQPLSVLRHLPEDSDRDKAAVYYCLSGKRTTGAVELLARRRHPECLLLDGGISAWEKSGFPVKKNRTSLPIMRQVHIAVGTMILAGMGLGKIIPAFFLLPVLIGAGLLFSGLTGSCGMAALLKRMPWNTAGGN